MTSYLDFPNTQVFHQFSDLDIEFDIYELRVVPWSICNGCGMPSMTPSSVPFLWTCLPELFVSLPGFSLQIFLGTFSIRLYELFFWYVTSMWYYMYTCARHQERFLRLLYSYAFSTRFTMPQCQMVICFSLNYANNFFKSCQQIRRHSKDFMNVNDRTFLYGKKALWRFDDSTSRKHYNIVLLCRLCGISTFWKPTIGIHTCIWYI